VGMNRLLLLLHPNDIDVPHTRGDEPAFDAISTT